MNRPRSYLLVALVAAIGYLIVGPNVSDTALYVGAAAAIALTLGVAYLMREPITADEVDAEPDQVADRWSTAAGFAVIAVGVVSQPILTDGIVQWVAHLAITLMLAVHVADEVYHAKARRARS